MGGASQHKVLEGDFVSDRKIPLDDPYNRINVASGMNKRGVEEVQSARVAVESSSILVASRFVGVVAGQSKAIACSHVIVLGSEPLVPGVPLAKAEILDTWEVAVDERLEDGVLASTIVGHG